jgi:allantoinase
MDSVGLSAFMARRASQTMAPPLSRGATQSMGADKPTRRALLWCSAAAFQCLPREGPLPAHCALLRNTTATLNPSIQCCWSTGYEYGSRVGYWRLLRAFEDRGLKATVNLVGLAGERNPKALKAMIDAGFDLQPHGWRWIDFNTLDEATERELIDRSIQQVRELTSDAPLGYYAGLPSMNTRRLVVESGNFLYDSDVYNDDLPYWSADYPELLLMPYSLDTNDSKFGRGESDYQLGDEFFTYLKDSFNILYAEGETHPKMMTIGLHARLIGRPGRIGALHQFLDYLLGHERVWICRRNDLARYWAENYPPE